MRLSVLNFGVTDIFRDKRFSLYGKIGVWCGKGVIDLSPGNCDCFKVYLLYFIAKTLFVFKNKPLFLRFYLIGAIFNRDLFFVNFLFKEVANE